MHLIFVFGDLSGLSQSSPPPRFPCQRALAEPKASERKIPPRFVQRRISNARKRRKRKRKRKRRSRLVFWTTRVRLFNTLRPSKQPLVLHLMSIMTLHASKKSTRGLRRYLTRTALPDIRTRIRQRCKTSSHMSTSSKMATSRGMWNLSTAQDREHSRPPIYSRPFQPLCCSTSPLLQTSSTQERWKLYRSIDGSKHMSRH